MIKKARCIIVLVSISICFVACGKTFQPQNPEGLVFPSVEGSILSGQAVQIPQFFAGSPVLLLVGYVQDSQFDVDRWVLGLKQLGTEVAIAEIPAIQGFFPRMLKSKIDQGMRNGIPEEDWGIVITVYEDAERVAQFLGNTKPRNVRVLLLDQTGTVRWFHDRGFSPDKALALDALIRKISQSDSSRS